MTQPWPPSHSPHPPYLSFPRRQGDAPPRLAKHQADADAVTLYSYDAVCSPVRPESYYVPRQSHARPWVPAGPPSASPHATGSRGRDYLLSLSTSMHNMDLSLGTHQRAMSAPVESSQLQPASTSAVDKPLPRLPPPPLPARPHTEVYSPSRPNWCTPAYPGNQPNHPINSSVDLTGGPKTASHPGRDQPVIIPQFKPPSLPTSISQPILSRPFRPHPATPSNRTLVDSNWQPSSAPAPRLHPRWKPPSAPDSPSKIPKSRSSRNTLSQPRSHVIDLTYIPSSPSSASSSSSGSVQDNVTPRSAHRKARASGADGRFSQSPTKTPFRIGLLDTPASRASRSMSVVDSGSPNRSPKGKRIGETRQCCGFTKIGQRCKRQVKLDWSAPSVSPTPPADIPRRLHASPFSGREEDQEEEGEADRVYCKDHAGLICQPEGFYWRHPRPTSFPASPPAENVWIDFARFIPPSLGLGQHVQAQLRACMESPLTAKEEAGLIYVYELRDLQTPTTAFYKVGKTTNLARRMTEWRTKCASHSMVLRDEYPLRPSVAPASSGPRPLGPLYRAQVSGSPASVAGLMRKPSGPTSFLPGHIRASASRPLAPAVKRLERLVHLELGERSRQARPAELQRVRARCDDCGREHREIFALARMGGVGGGGGVGGAEYDEVVREVIVRWERFVRLICTGEAR